MNDTDKLTPEEAAKYKRMASREYYEHSYSHRKADPDNCAACAHRLKVPNVSGWPLVRIALGLPMNRAAYERELRRADASNPGYAANIRRYIATFGHPGWL